MKFIATLALVAMVSAINIEAETETKTQTTTEATTEIATEVTAQQPGGGDYANMVPEDYYNAVQNFDLSKPFTDQDCFKKQVDIYSDQIIAIEALRVEVMKLDYAITQAENDQRASEQKILQNGEAIMSNYQEALDDKAKIEKLQLDTDDVAQCLKRQFDEQRTLRSVLELYCHQFTYVPQLPAQCQQILGADTMIYHAYSWPGQ